MYKKILVGVDASELSTKALEVAGKLARDAGAQLHVFHAVAHHYQLPPIQIPLLVPMPSAVQTQRVDPTEIQRYHEEKGKEVIAHAKAVVEGLKLGPEVVVQFHLELAISPEDFAQEFAKKNDVDLIVVGCKGHHGRLRRALLGTVATKIVNEAPCHVLVVR